MIPLRVAFMNVICVEKVFHVKVIFKYTSTITKLRKNMTRIWIKGLQKPTVQYAKKSKRNFCTTKKLITECVLLINYFVFVLRVTRKNLKTHIKLVHEKTMIKTHTCEVCGKAFSASSKLAQHAIIHVDFNSSKIQCEVCGKYVKNKNTLRSHKLTHIQTEFQCPHCDKVKFNKAALLSHIGLRYF